MMSLGDLWGAVPGVGILFSGAIANHLWARFRNRMAVVHWHATVMPLAAEEDDPNFGKLTIQHNGSSIEGLALLGIALKNTSQRDLADLDVVIGFENGPTFLSGAAAIDGSHRTLDLAPHWLALHRANPDNPKLRSYLEYRVPALNRGSVVRFWHYLHIPRGIDATTLPLVSSQHLGTRLVWRAEEQTLLGESQSRAALVGSFVSAAAVVVITAMRPPLPLLAATCFGLGLVCVLVCRRPLIPACF